MFDIYYSVSSRLTSEHVGGFSPHATWPNPLSYQISSSEPSARARVTQLRARSSCAPGAAPGSCAQPPLATRRPRARVVAPRPAQLALGFDASSGSELRRDERLRTEERAEKERADAVAEGADGRSSRRGSACRAGRSPDADFDERRRRAGCASARESSSQG